MMCEVSTVSGYITDSKHKQKASRGVPAIIFREYSAYWDTLLDQHQDILSTIPVSSRPSENLQENE